MEKFRGTGVIKRWRIHFRFLGMLFGMILLFQNCAQSLPDVESTNSNAATHPASNAPPPPIEVTASGIWNHDTSGTYVPAHALDKNMSTRWAGNSDGSPVWYQLDLGGVYLVRGITISWEYAGTYRVDISSDGLTWVNLKTGTAPSGSTTTDGFTGSGGGGWYGRFVRISPAASTDEQYRSIWEINLDYR